MLLPADGYELQHPISSQARSTFLYAAHPSRPHRYENSRLDIAEAEDAWEREEETRRRAIREERWEEVKQEAFVQLAYQRNIEQLQQQLAHADDAARMRSYADSVEAHATTLGPSDEEAARGWAAWIRHHATSIDPLNGALRQLKVTEARHEDLQPFMHGWSAYGAYRRP